MLSINNRITIEAYNRGYRLNDNGVLINKTGMPLKGFVTNTKRTPYRMSTMRMNGKNVNSIITNYAPIKSLAQKRLKLIVLGI